MGPAKNVILSGRYFHKEYEGLYSNISNWCKHFELYVRKQGMNIRKRFMWYTTCSKYAKKKERTTPSSLERLTVNLQDE